jgi:hypothetical protein
MSYQRILEYLQKDWEKTIWRTSEACEVLVSYVTSTPDPFISRKDFAITKKQEKYQQKKIVEVPSIRIDFSKKLVRDLILIIFGYLDGRSLAQVSKVNSILHEIAQSRSLDHIRLKDCKADSNLLERVILPTFLEKRFLKKIL